MNTVFQEMERLSVGNTPFEKFQNLPDTFADIYVKREDLNASGSVKDRAALFMIMHAVKTRELEKGGVIVEATSGNMGIALAYLGALMNFKVILTMPDTMSYERKEKLAYLGAKLVLTKGSDKMAGAVKKAEEIALSTKGAVLMRQFDNRANAEAHYQTTAEEIISALGRAPDIFTAGVGSGGTLCGAGKKFKEKGDTYVVAVEPEESAVLSGGKAGAHAVQGIGANFVPSLFDRKTVDEIVTVTSEKAVETAKRLRAAGYYVGISSGANFWAAYRLACLKVNAGKSIVTLFPDCGDRYDSVLGRP